MLSLRTRPGNKIIKKSKYLFLIDGCFCKQLCRLDPMIATFAKIYLKFNTLLSFNALLKSMFYHGHFGHGIGDIYYFRRSIATRQN